MCSFLYNKCRYPGISTELANSVKLIKGVKKMKIAILGGGYGGTRIINTLLGYHLPKEVELILIDRTPYHSFKTEFYALAAGTVSDKDVRSPFPKHDQLRIVIDEILSVDPNKNTINLRGNDPVVYDYLVVGLGCEDHYHGTEGAKEFTHSIQTISKSRRTFEALNNIKGYGTATIVGAGLSGVELVAELRESRPDLNIQLLDRGDTILRPFHRKVQQHATKWLESHDIKIIHNSHVDYVEKGAVCNNGVCLLSDSIVWTAGVRPNRIVRSMPFTKDKQERIVIDEYHRVPSHPNVFVVGDCASLPLSPSAQLAQQQGSQIAAILFSLIKKEELKSPGDIKLKGTLASLGKVDGFAEIGKMPVTGWFARFAKSGVLWLHKRHTD